MLHKLLLIFISTWSHYLVPIYLRLAHRFSWIDHPSPRRIHKIPTPTGGGIVIVIPFLLALTVSYSFGSIDTSLWLIICLGSLLLTAMNFRDDYAPISPRLRLIVQFMIICLTLLYLDDVTVLNLGFINLKLQWFGYSIMTFALVWLMNLYNFMDGIDGLACMEAIFVSLAMTFLLVLSGNAALAWIYFILALLVAGFLWWNWAPAKIFLGDTGSTFLGYIFGVLGVASSNTSHIPIWSMLILFGVFLVDASITLLRRTLQGKPLMVPHCSHIYQKLTKKWGCHRKVCLLFFSINLLWLFPWSFIAYLNPHLGMFYSFLALLPLIVFAWQLGAGVDEPK